jgi:hypothetical protein
MKDELKKRALERSNIRNAKIKEREKQFYELLKNEILIYEKCGKFNTDFLKSYTNILD